MGEVTASLEVLRRMKRRVNGVHYAFRTTLDQCAKAQAEVTQHLEAALGTAAATGATDSTLNDGQSAAAPFAEAAAADMEPASVLRARALDFTTEDSPSPTHAAGRV